MDYRDTLNLPDQDFTIPMRAGLPSLEARIQKKWDDMDLYGLIQKKGEGRKRFIFHDGPPYTNYPIHMGTALNRILKDFIVRFRTMAGEHVPFTPGFDNHGMPIEQAVLKRFKEQGHTPNKTELVAACREHAHQFIDLQTRQSKRLGVVADWDRPYYTMEYAYEAQLVRSFGRLVQQGYVYRGQRPVIWCPSCSTALAEAEIEYETHASDSIHVAFPLLDDPDGVFAKIANPHALIWTTTPWTIPANLAIAVGPGLTYSFVQVDGMTVVILEDLVSTVVEKLKLEDYHVVGTAQGEDLKRVVWEHPIFDRPSVTVLVNYVREDEGTGLIHTAPGHGAEDFYTGKQNGLEILCPVDAHGVFTEEAGEFAGVPIRPEGNKRVIARLQAMDRLLSHTKYEHQYPHCWRCDSPLIFRATSQWFVSIGHEGLRERMLGEVDKTRWVPGHTVNRIRAMVEGRPDWCISRQRTWGIPIPALYVPGGSEPYQSADLIERAAQIVEKGGIAAWFEARPDDIMGHDFEYKGVKAALLEKETDILDVWFDSGCSSLCVLDSGRFPNLEWPADLYLEGSDQHRGWFNTSLVTGCALKGAAPYRTVITHGFILDANMRKMSKSEGNAIEPMEQAEKFGADILRLWGANVDYFEDVPASEELFQQYADSFRKVRNTLRFLLANLADFDESKAAPLLEIDRWALHWLNISAERIAESFEQYEFAKGWQALQYFCTQDLSSFYMDVTKDRLYCEPEDSPARRAAQTAYLKLASGLCRACAPILPHAMEEVWERLPLADKAPSVHLTEFPKGAAGQLSAMEEKRWEFILALREEINRSLEDAKQAGLMKDTQEAKVAFGLSPDELELLGPVAGGLGELLKVSAVDVCERDRAPVVTVAPGEKCARCWLRRTDVGSSAEHPTVCARCAAVVSGL